MHGKLIVLYGINNLGKSTQAKMLMERMNTEGQEAVYLKYPLYDLAPSGPLINEYLRGGNPHNLSAREAQLLYILNRTQYEATVQQTLAAGTHIVAEDYTGTGIAWGVAAGVDKTFLIKANQHLLREDLAFYFKGDRFVEATEAAHKHETNNELISRALAAHEALCQENGWIRIDANREISIIHEELWNTVKEHVRNYERYENTKKE